MFLRFRGSVPWCLSVVAPVGVVPDLVCVQGLGGSACGPSTWWRSEVAMLAVRRRSHLVVPWSRQFSVFGVPAALAGEGLVIPTGPCSRGSPPLLPSARGSSSRELGVGRVAEVAVAPCCLQQHTYLTRLFLLTLPDLRIRGWRCDPRRSQRSAPQQHNTIVEHHHPEQPTKSRGRRHAQVSSTRERQNHNARLTLPYEAQPVEHHDTHQTTICESTPGARTKQTTRATGTHKVRQHGRENLETTNKTSWPTRGNSTVARNERRALLGRTSARSDKGRSWEEPSPEYTIQTIRTIRENTTVNRTAEAMQASPRRTSTRTTKAPFWENSPEHASQGNSRNERETVLRATLTRTTANSSGKLHQNTRQPSDAPQPRGQRDSNQKRAQHSPGETSLPPEPTEKNSRSTSLEFTTSQHQADNKRRQVSQCSTGDATPHTKHLRSSASRAQRTGTQGQTHNNHSTHPNNKGAANKAGTPSTCSRGNNPAR
ncbi:hypothetical protein Taro_025711 [Colocasia esculenta]|uniref:Uncharacterized protein n=1 Tax=Colocasia esculenta TaxID=4460 RepID=A0A843VF14_COLES|nr:hypothetical protein [Colocasia esculenta]